MSKKQDFLVVDTETGGLSCDEHSILSFAGVAWSVDGEPVKCFDLYIKEDDIKYIPKAIILYQDIYKLKPDLNTEIKQKIPLEIFSKLDPGKIRKLQTDYNNGSYLKTATVIPLQQLKL